MQVFANPANAHEWVLLGMGTIAFAVMAIAQPLFFVQPADGNRRAALFVEVNLACAVIEFVAILSRRTPSAEWAIAGTACYVAAVAIFLAALDASRHQLLPRPFVDDPAPPRAVTNGIFRIIRHPIYVSYSLALLGGAIATHSPTLIAINVIMLPVYVLLARREARLTPE